MSQPVKRVVKTIGYLLLGGLASLLLGWTAAFVAIRYNLTNVAGQVDRDSAAYLAIAPLDQPAVPTKPQTLLPIAETSTLGIVLDNISTTTLCQMAIISQAGYQAPDQAWQTINQHPELGWRWLTAAALSQWLTYRHDQEAISEQSLNSCLIKKIAKPDLLAKLNPQAKRQLFVWQSGEEWPVIDKALRKDQAVINKAAQAAGVEPRMVVAVAIVEQLRLYYTQRELFETIFKPLNILATANKMAWGVMAIKEKTAIATEQHLVDQQSPYYLGPDKAKLLELPATDQADVRYRRLTNERDHHYSYLYGALYLAQVVQQWQASGFDISQRPEILATLFNIGFDNSKPKADPQVGGSKINIAGREYSFGGLAYEFYYSSALADIFPH